MKMRNIKKRFNILLICILFVSFFTFNANAAVPTVTTNPATNIEETTATLNGILTSNGSLPTTCGFQYGLNTSYGTTVNSSIPTVTYAWSNQTSTDGTGYYLAYNTDALRLGMRIASFSVIPLSVEFYMKNIDAGATGNITSRIRYNSNNTIIVNSTNQYLASTISTSLTWYKFYFNTSKMINSQNIILSVELIDASGSYRTFVSETSGGQDIYYHSGVWTNRSKTLLRKFNYISYLLNPSSPTSSTFRPNGAIEHTMNNNGNPIGVNRQDNYLYVDDVTKDDDTTYVWGGSYAWFHDIYKIQNHTTQTGDINSVTAYCWAKSNQVSGTFSISLTLYIDGSYYESSSFSLVGVSAYTLFSYTWYTNPKTSSAWNWSAIDSMGLGFREQRDQSKEMQLTQIYSTVSHTEPFVYNISSLSSGTIYHYRAKVSNSNGTSYGSDKMFSTKPLTPNNLSVGTIKTTSKLRISWNNASKGTGVNMTTHIRYRTTEFPLTRADGVLLYNGTGNSTNITNWVHDTTYYISAWHYITGGSSAFWSDSYSTASYTTPTTIHVFAVTAFRNNTINLSWTSGDGKTVIVRNATSDPTSPDKGIKVYNGTGTTFSDTGLSPSHKYYYRAFCWNSTWGYNPDNCSLNQYTRPNKPYDLNITVVSYNSINITWLNGTGTTSTVIRKSTTTQPLLPSDGTLLYNGTLKYKVDNSITGLNNYYTLFSYNSTTHQFSEAEPLIWYVVWVNVYNEISGSNILNWNISFANPEGTQTYTKKGCNNPTIFNISDIPQGTNIGLFITAANYENRQYYLDIDIEGNYNLDCYLAPVSVSNTHLYYCQVIDTYTTPLKSVVTQFKVSVNGSTYILVDQLLTDDNGYVNLYLQGGVNYKVIMTKDGYDMSISDWMPDVNNYGIYYPKIFVLRATETNYTPTEKLWDNISYTFTPENRYQNNSFNLYFNITSSNNRLSWYIATLYYWNTTTSIWDLLSTDNQTSSVGGSISFVVPNIPGRYVLVSAFKKINFSTYNMGYQYWFIYEPPTSAVETGDIPDNIYLGITIIIMMIVIGAASYFAGATAGILGIAVEGIMFAMRPDLTFGDPAVSCWFIFLATVIAYFFLMFLRGR